MRKILTLLAVLVFCAPLLAQVVTVKDAQSDQPVELVNIYSKSPKASALTNAAGQANMDSFKGSDEILFQMIGYEPVHISYNELKDHGFILVIHPTNISLEQVVVSATKWNQPVQDVPAKVTTIMPRETYLQNPQTAADMLTISGEVFMQKSQLGGGSPMIRGFATNRVLLAVDGIRMNNAIFRSGNLQNVINIDPFAIERTEVMFGPGSILYGSDAIGGVMSFYTLTPQLSLGDKPFIKGSATVRQSTANDEVTGNVNINIGWKKWALVTGFTVSEFGDMRMGTSGPDEYLRPFYVQTINGSDIAVTNEDPLVQKPTGYTQFNFLQKVMFKPNADWDFTYGFYYSTTGDYSRYDRLIRTRGGNPRSAEWYYGPQEWAMNSLSITNHTSNAMYDEMSIKLAYQYFEESRNDRDFNDPELHQRIEAVDAYSANFDFTKDINETNTIVYGVEAVYNDITSVGIEKNVNTNDKVDGPARYPESDWTSLAAYATYMYQVRDNLTLSAGVRYNQFMLNATFDNTFYNFPFSEAEINSGALTGSIGAVYNPGNKWTIGAHLSTGFRSPNVDDVGKVFDSEPGSVVVPNPDLESEYAYNAELSVAKVFSDVVKVDLTGYYTLLEDALVRRDFTLNGADSINYDGQLSQVQAIQNAAEAHVWGVQAGLEIKLPAGFGFSSRFNYQEGEEELDDGTTDKLRHAAPWFGATHLTYTMQKLNVDLYALYNGEVSFEDMPSSEADKGYMYAIDENGNPYSPSWITLNLKMMYQVSDIISVSSGIENIADRRYRPYSSGIVAPGRNFIISTRVKF